MTSPTRPQDPVDFTAPRGTGDAAVLHQALVFFLRTQLGATALPVAPNLTEQRKLLPLIESFAKAMMLCAAGDGKLATEELEWILGFTANAGGTFELLEELRALDPASLDAVQLLRQTESPGLFVHALVYNSIAAADADGVLEAAEVQTIAAMAMALGLLREDIEGLFALYKEEQAFYRRKMIRLFPNGHPWG